MGRQASDAFSGRAVCCLNLVANARRWDTLPNSHVLANAATPHFEGDLPRSISLILLHLCFRKYTIEACTRVGIRPTRLRMNPTS